MASSTREGGESSNFSNTSPNTYCHLGWNFNCNADSKISSSKCTEMLQSKFSFPIPGITYPENYLRIEYGKFLLIFDLISSLKEISTKAPDGRYVFAAKSWTPIGGFDKLSWDWTYFSLFEGSITCDPEKTKIECLESPKESLIDKILLSKNDPFLWFKQFYLYEDELSDGGISSYSVKIRVMPECFLILATMHSRIDHVLERQKETRYFFKNNPDDDILLVKNVKYFELDYESAKGEPKLDLKSEIEWHYSFSPN